MTEQGLAGGIARETTGIERAAPLLSPANPPAGTSRRAGPRNLAQTGTKEDPGSLVSLPHWSRPWTRLGFAHPSFVGARPCQVRPNAVRSAEKPVMA